MDLISRQAAIDALNLQLSDWNCDYNVPVCDCIEIIERLPSAQPERRDCGWTGIEDDYPVSVKEVIDITAETGAVETQRRIKELKPFSQPERKTGKWLMNGERYGVQYWRCSECGEEYSYIEMNFCPNCGAMNSESLKAAEIGKEVARGLKSGVRGEKDDEW